ncbi:MAG: biotin/lipoyl-containing protein [Emergencia sp.]
METYIIRVNGIEYEVEVEKKSEAGARTAGTPAEAVSPSGRARTQTARPEPAGKAAPAEGKPVTCGTAGKVWKITAKEGDHVSKGDTILILEAMKMEIPVVAPSDGTVTAVLAAEGESVEAGQSVASIA